MNDAPIYFEAQGCSGEVTGSFTAFGLPEGAMSRASLAIKFTLAFVKVDNTDQEVKVDITAAVTAPSPPPAPPEEGGGDPVTDIEIPIDEEIEVDDVEVPPDGGGGMGGDVGDWDDETNVELPVI